MKPTTAGYGDPWQMPTTCHAYPWALVRRGGHVDGQRPRTRLAYMTGTYVPRGATKAEAMTGFFVRIGRDGWPHRETKGKVRVAWGDVVKSWRRQPGEVQIARARAAMRKQSSDVQEKQP